MQSSNWIQTKMEQFLNWMTNQNILQKSGESLTVRPGAVRRDEDELFEVVLSKMITWLGFFVINHFFRKGDEEWQKVIGEHRIDLDLTQAGFQSSDWPIYSCVIWLATDKSQSEHRQIENLERK